MHGRRTSRTTLALLPAVLGLLLAGLAAPATAATGTGAVKGVVSIAGQPVKNAKVQLYMHQRADSDDTNYEYDRVKTVSTDGKGRYAFSGVKTGTWRGGAKYLYAVLVTDRSGRGAKTVQYLDVSKGRTRTRNVALKRAVILTGSVQRSDGGSPAALTVLMSSNETVDDRGASNQEFRPDSRTSVRPDGTFTVKGQAAGEYELVVRSEEYVNHCYDFEVDALAVCDNNRSGQDVVLTAGERRVLAPSVVTQLAPPVSTITGRVTDPSGRGLKGIAVSTSPLSRDGKPLVTRSNGRFTLKERLEPGSYLLRFEDPKHVWASLVRGASARSTARIVVGADGLRARDIDAKLKSSTVNRVTWTSGKGFIEMTYSLRRRASSGRPGGTMTITADGRTATATVRQGKVTVRLTGLGIGRHAVTAIYSGTSSTAGFTRNFSPK